MAKNKTEIHVTTVFDGELDATDVFVSLISQKYGKTNAKENLEFSKATNPKAQPEWFEAAKASHGRKWIKDTKAIAGGG